MEVDPLWIVVILVTCVEVSVLTIVYFTRREVRSAKRNTARIERRIFGFKDSEGVQHPSEITTALVAQVVEGVQLDVALENWLQSDRGKEVIGKAVVTTAEVVKQKVVSSLEGVAGNAVKRVQNAHSNELLNELAAQDLGHPILNGLWATLVRSHGPKMLKRIGEWARSKGWIEAEYDDVTGQQPQLEGPVSASGDEVYFQ